MNRKTQVILLGALALQGVLALLTWNLRGGGGPSEAKPFLGFEKSAVTALEIIEKASGDDKAEIRLEKQGDGWVVASAGGFPAKKDKVEELVGKLTDLQVRDPVGTQKANHNALHVGADVWGRKVKITAGGQTKEVILGAGSGASVHLRFADADAVFRGRGLSEYAVSGRISSYVETDFVKVESDKVNEVLVTNASGTLSFRKDGENWVLAELPPGQTLDQAAVKSFVSSVARLTLKEPVGKTVEPAFGLDAGTQVTIRYTEEANAKSASYKIGAAKDGAHYVQAEGQDFVVLVAEWATKSAREKTPLDFVKKEEPPKPGGGEMDLPAGFPGGGDMPPFPPPGGDPHGH